MLDLIKKKFKEEYGAEPLIPENSVVFESKLFETSNSLKSLKFKIKPLSKGLLLWDKYPTHSFLDYNKNRIKNYIVLNEKSSFLITCGRKLLKKGIIKKSGKGNVFAAFNEKKEIVGVIQFKNKTYNNKVNIGVYLDQDRLKKVIF